MINEKNSNNSSTDLNKDYQLWKAYKMGLLDRSFEELTEEEQSEIMASEFAMNFLVPSKFIKLACIKYGGIEKANNSYKALEKLADEFDVAIEVIKFKLTDLINEKHAKGKQKLLKK